MLDLNQYCSLRSAGSGPPGGKISLKSAGRVNDMASNCCKVRGVMVTVRGPTFVLFFCTLMVTDPTFSSSVRSA